MPIEKVILQETNKLTRKPLGLEMLHLRKLEQTQGTHPMEEQIPLFNHFHRIREEEVETSPIIAKCKKASQKPEIKTSNWNILVIFPPRCKSNFFARVF